jgi:hypothetical protein
MSKTDSLRKRICQFYEKHSMKKRSFILNHFLEEGITRSTIFCILKQCDNKISPERKKGFGRKAIKIPLNKVKSVIKHLDHHGGRS